MNKQTLDGMFRHMLQVHGIGMRVVEMIPADKLDEQTICERIKTHADLVRFAKESWDAGAAAREKITDQHLSAVVQTPWNYQAPGYIMFGITHDEYLHHRGQLYAYLRVFGVEPVMMWDFGHNAPEYQPKQPAGA